MAHARLHIICGNCGCNDMWKFRINDEGQDFGDYCLPEVYLICGNCATLHSLSDNAERWYWMINKERRGTVAIRPGNKHQEPTAVYVGGINGFDMTICKVLNSDEILFSCPEESDLMDMDYKQLERMRAEWAVDNAERVLSRCRDKLEGFGD